MKVKIVGIFICMLLIFAAISVAKTSNESDFNSTKNKSKAEYYPSTYDQDWWSMFRHDAANSGCSSCIAPDTNELCWQQSTYDFTEFATPIVVDDKLYISTGGYYNLEPPDLINSYLSMIQEKPTLISRILEMKSNFEDEYYGSLYCYEAVNGTLLWDFFIGQGQDPAVCSGNVYTTSSDWETYDSKVYCLDAETGETILWEQTISGLILSSVIIYENKIYVGGLDFTSYCGKLYCLNAENGDIIWTHTMDPFEIMYFSSPTVDDGYVYFVVNNLYSYFGKLYCLSAETGDYQWEKSIGYTELCSPAVENGKVFVMSMDIYTYTGCLYCFNAYSGSELWRFNLGFYQFSFSNPAIYDDSIYLAVIDYSFFNGKIYRIDIETGNEIWNIHTSGFPYYSSPAVADDKLYISTVDFYSYLASLICLDVEDGGTIWSYPLDFLTMNSPAIANGRVYIADYTGEIYSIGYPNDPPTPPNIDGKLKGRPGKSYDFTFVSTDPESEKVYYFIYWGDGTMEPWMGPYDSDEVVTVSHSWDEKGMYNITARAKDEHGSTSEWSTLEISMPFVYQSSNSNPFYIFNRLIQHFPILSKIFIFLQINFFKSFEEEV